MHDSVEHKLEEIEVVAMLALDDDKDSEGNTITRWAARDCDNKPIMVELYEDGFLDVWYSTDDIGTRESLFSDWVLI